MISHATNSMNRHRNPFGRFSVSTLAAVLLFATSSTWAQVSPPSLDGLEDAQYNAYGISSDYIGFHPDATAKAVLIDSPQVDPNYIWLLWNVGKFGKPAG